MVSKYRFFLLFFGPLVSLRRGFTLTIVILQRIRCHWPVFIKEITEAPKNRSAISTI